MRPAVPSGYARLSSGRVLPPGDPHRLISKHQFMQETMRMRPAVPSGYARLVARDVRLSNGLVLPRGALITGQNLATLNSPAFWEQPERFMPVGLPCYLLLWPGQLRRSLCWLGTSLALHQCLHAQQPVPMSVSCFRLVHQPGTHVLDCSETHSINYAAPASTNVPAFAL